MDALLQQVDRATATDPRRALQLVEKALADIRRGGGPEAIRDRARLHRYRGHALRALNEFSAAISEYGRALALFRKRDDALEAAITQIGRIDALMYRGRYRDALEAATEARRVFVARRNWVRVARLDSNTGNLFHRWDRPADALRYYDRARAIFRRLNDRAGLAIVDFNRGNVLATLARFEDAESAYRSARTIFLSLGQDVMTAKADYGIAYLFFLEERLTEALAAFDALRPALDRLAERRLMALCDMDTAEILLRLNLWTDAAERATRAAASFRLLEMRYEEARCAAFEGAALMKTGRPDRALARWRRAARLFDREQNRTWRGVISLHMARLERKRGHAATARRLAADALRRLAPPAPPERRAEALFVKGSLDAGGDGIRRRRAARDLLIAARRLARKSGATWLVRDCEEELGELARAEGRRSAARRHLVAAVNAGERLRSLLHGDDFRAAFFRDRARPYVALAAIDLVDGDVDGAFNWVERGRSRALLEGLEDLPRRSKRARDRSGEARELEAILRRLGAQYREERLPAGDARPSAEAARLPDRVRGHLESRAEEIIGRIYPEYRRGRIAPSPGRGASAPGVPLGAGEALISYCEVDGAVMAFVRTSEGLSVATDLASVKDVLLAADRLSYQWGRFRLGRDMLERHGRLLLADALEDLTLLHGLLVAPLARLAGKDTWIVIPSRSMASIPFAALHDGRRFLAESTTVAIAPATGVFTRCRRRLARRPRGSLVVGQCGPATPEVEPEIAAVSRQVPWQPVRVLTGKEATVGTVGREAAGRAFIHLASHGFFHAERPQLSGIRLADRWLHAHDTLGMDLSAELVVLSACQSGMSQVLEGDEWLGLPRAFLRAGAARVLASLWDVDDRATRNLMTRFSEALARPDSALPAVALRRAQAQVIEEQKHPYFWAGFQLVGTP